MKSTPKYLKDHLKNVQLPRQNIQETSQNNTTTKDKKEKAICTNHSWSLGFKQKEGEEKERREGGENWNIMMESKKIIDQKIKA